MTKTLPSARRERGESRRLSRRGFLSLAGVTGLLGLGIRHRLQRGREPAEDSTAGDHYGDLLRDHLSRDGQDSAADSGQG